MKYAVMFDETWRYTHRIIINCDEENVDNILDSIQYEDLDSALYRLEQNPDVEIIEVDREYEEDCDGTEISDTYEYDDGEDE